MAKVMPKTGALSYPRTRLALRGFDKDADIRVAAWNSVKTQKEIVECHRVDNEARLKVCEAFWEDTKAINALSGCQVLSVSDIREIVSWRTRQK